jgi:hypothetical protein
MDDSASPETHIVSLSGITVFITEYSRLRDNFYRSLAWAIQPGERVVNLYPPELHGSNLLRDCPGDVDDELRMRVLSDIVSLVVENGLDIWRVGYYTSPKMRRLFPRNEHVLGFCWSGMLAILEPVLADSYVIPVMDSCNQLTSSLISQAVRCLDVGRQTDIRHSLVVRHSENIIGEVFYADSRYAAFTQVADIVAYLRHVADLEREGKRLSGFKRELLKLAVRLEPAVAAEHVVALRFDGQKIAGGEGYKHVRVPAT